ncbi:MAG: hypothetical protein MHM6MM_006686 [Cercozoa sp. M6MM]
METRSTCERRSCEVGVAAPRCLAFDASGVPDNCLRWNDGCRECDVLYDQAGKHLVRCQRIVANCTDNAAGQARCLIEGNPNDSDTHNDGSTLLQ